MDESPVAEATIIDRCETPHVFETDCNSVSNSPLFGENLQFLSAPTITPELATDDFAIPATVFSDPTLNRTLDFADAAIQAAEQLELADQWATFEIPELDPATIEPVLIQSAQIESVPDVASELDGDDTGYLEPLNEADAANAVTDRAYATLWDRLASVIVEPPPWSIAVAETARNSDPSWLILAAKTFIERTSAPVLLIEADSTTATELSDATRAAARQRSLQELLDVCPNFGLTDVLAGDVAWQDAIVPTTIPGVSLLANIERDCDSISDANYAAADLIAELKTNFGLILIRAHDCERLANGPLVAACDGAIILVELARTTHATAEATAESLRGVGARPLGCVARG